MALKSATTTLATIQMRRGAEENFDPDQMTAGEWAVSTDSKKVWMCFRPGLVLRMATYEAFEKDMEEIRAILVEAKDIQTAIERWNYLAESYAHGGTGKREGEDTDNAKYYSEQAKASADKAESLADIGIMTTEKAGIGKPDGETITVDEDGTMRSVSGGADIGIATTEKAGIVKPDGETITVDEDGTMRASGVEIGDFASKTIYGDDFISLNRKNGSIIGKRSISYGNNNEASNYNSVSLGARNIASGDSCFSAGYKNKSLGLCAASFGHNNVSLDDYSFSEGCGNISLGYGSHAENCKNISGAKHIFKISSFDTVEKKFMLDSTYDGFSDAFSALEVGSNLFVQNTKYVNDASIYTVSKKGSDGKSVTVNENIPTSNYSVLFATIIKSGVNYYGCHTEGTENISSGNCAHSEGYRTKSCGYCSHTEGNTTKATANQAHSEGYKTEATGRQSHAGGNTCRATGEHSFAHGFSSDSTAESSSAFGYSIVSLNFAEFKCGKHSRSDVTGGDSNNTTGNAFVVGNGTENTNSNAFSVRYDGTVRAKSTITASTVADYSEFFEWLDKNAEKEDRVGKFVTVDGNKIKIANSGDYILGIVSGAPFVLGNGDCDMWNGAYLRDDFGRVIYEPAPKVEIDEETGESHIVVDENGDTVFYGTKPKINPEYDQSRIYIPREERPEWDAVGMLGVLPVRDDGTCEVGKFCRCSDGGIATLSTERGIDTYMVVERVRKNIVRVILK